VASALLVGKGLMSLAQHKADELAKQGVSILSGRVETEQARAQSPTMTQAWHPGASTN
jgi:hypothetical protein